MEEGDVVERPLPTSVETYTVVERGYYAAVHGIPPHYQMKVRKNSPSETKESSQPAAITHVYNLIGDQARVNIQSDDRSVNISSVTNEQLFTGMAKTIREHVVENRQREDMLSKLAALKAADRKTVGEKYREFIATAADHMSLLLPFLPALSALIVGIK